MYVMGKIGEYLRIINVFAKMVILITASYQTV